MKMTVIPPMPKITAHNDTITKKKRVAAYARVSTDTEEQLSSYEAQVDHYTKHIKEKPEWDFAGMYTDDSDIIITNEEIPLIMRVSRFVIIFFYKLN